MSNITVLGATSATGKLLLPLLLSKGHHVTVLARNSRNSPSSSANEPTDPRVTTMFGDVTATDDVARAIERAESIICLIGARKGQPVGTVRSATTAALVKAVQQSNPTAHLIVVSALGGTESQDQLTPFARFIYRKVIGAERLQEVDRQEQILTTSGLLATVVRPPKLDDKPGATPKVVNRVGSSASLHRADLASHLANCIGPRPTSITFRTVASA
jgi:uncharacterized protein YbjT (DUF2867 family)